MGYKKKIAITGANGYLGKHTITAAIQKGWQVIGIVRREEAVKEIENLGAQAIIIKDFNYNTLRNTLIGCTAVLHFRGVVCGSDELFKKVNIEGMRALIKAASDAKVSRIIFPSGLGVDKYQEEEWANNAYFYSKHVAEQLLREGGVPYIIFRPSYILGPEDELIPDLIEQIGNSIIHIAGDGNVPMQPIYVKDAVKAFLAAAEGINQENLICDLVGPQIMTMRELIKIIFDSITDLGFNIPEPRIIKVSYDDAPEKLEICKEMVDVMRCNITSDGKVTAKLFGFKLSNPIEAIKSAVLDKLFPKIDKKEKSAIVLLSGGLDSAVALYWAKNEGYDLIALSINYRNRPENEKKAAKKLADILDIQIIDIPLNFIMEPIDLRLEGYPSPSAINAPEGYIPSRNLVFYSIAAYYAEMYGCSIIIGGHISSDSQKFPDADLSFFKSLEVLIHKGKHIEDKSHINLIIPLSKLSKEGVVKKAKELYVPLNLTWSCYSDGKKPCGNCQSCQKRKIAFQNSNYSDLEFSL
jgi:7-cyano-7-deazaguanine synthase